jgi:hypothetical protein
MSGVRVLVATRKRSRLALFVSVLLVTALNIDGVESQSQPGGGGVR